jgi:NTE family protein
VPEPIIRPEQHSTTTTQPNVLCEPVQYLESEKERLREGMALCLSGGGYRAMLFHTGVLWRLNEIGLLPKLNRISSVSGGSITAAVLALKWRNALRFENGVATNFRAEVVDPIMRLAGRTIDVPSVFGGSLWFGSIGDKITKAYRKHLFGDATLQDIVDETPGVSPRFVFNATNVQSGVLWRFMKPYMRDYLVGEVKNPKVPLAQVVAASAAFPPVLSPITLKLNPKDFTPNSGKALQRDEFMRRVVLTDGGVYDNLGLETAWKSYKTIFVSDAGGGFEAKANPSSDWVRHAVRVLFTIDNQVRSLRKRQIVGAYFDKIRSGAYWSISENLDVFAAQNPLKCPFDSTIKLAEISTRLCKLDRTTQQKLINWGYAASSWRYGRYVDPSLPAANTFPFPDVGV